MQPRTIKEVYGGYESEDFVLKMKELGVDALVRLKKRRTDLMNDPLWYGNKTLDRVLKDITFWESIVSDTEHYLNTSEKISNL